MTLNKVSKRVQLFTKNTMKLLKKNKRVVMIAVCAVLLVLLGMYAYKNMKEGFEISEASANDGFKEFMSIDRGRVFYNTDSKYEVYDNEETVRFEDFLRLVIDGDGDGNPSGEETYDLEFKDGVINFVPTSNYNNNNELSENDKNIIIDALDAITPTKYGSFTGMLTWMVGHGSSEHGTGNNQHNHSSNNANLTGNTMGGYMNDMGMGSSKHSIANYMSYNPDNDLINKLIINNDTIQFDDFLTIDSKDFDDFLTIDRADFDDFLTIDKTYFYDVLQEQNYNWKSLTTNLKDMKSGNYTYDYYDSSSLPPTIIVMIIMVIMMSKLRKEISHDSYNSYLQGAGLELKYHPTLKTLNIDIEDLVEYSYDMFIVHLINETYNSFIVVIPKNGDKYSLTPKELYISFQENGLMSFFK